MIPTDIPGLKYWFRADGGGTELFQDSALTIPATANADPVGGWKDQSGNTYHATAAANGNRPSLRTNVQNGLSVVRFDGSASPNNDYLSTTGATLSQPNTIFVVASWSTGTGRILVGSITAGVLNNISAVTASSQWQLSSGSTLTSSGTLTASAKYTFSAIYNGASSKGYRDRSLEMSGNAGSQSLASLRIGSNTAGTGGQWNGDVCEVVVYNSALSDADRASVESYLALKWFDLYSATAAAAGLVGTMAMTGTVAPPPALPTPPPTPTAGPVVRRPSSELSNDYVEPRQGWDAPPEKSKPQDTTTPVTASPPPPVVLTEADRALSEAGAALAATLPPEPLVVAPGSQEELNRIALAQLRAEETALAADDEQALALILRMLGVNS